MKNQINRDLGEILRDEMVMKEHILTRLREEPATISSKKSANPTKKASISIDRLNKDIS